MAELPSFNNDLSISDEYVNTTSTCISSPSHLSVSSITIGLTIVLGISLFNKSTNPFLASNFSTNILPELDITVQSILTLVKYAINSHSSNILELSHFILPNISSFGENITLVPCSLFLHLVVVSLTK